MTNLKKYNLGELRAFYIEWRDLYSQYGAENFKENALEVEQEILSRCLEAVEEEPKKKEVIEVIYEIGYKWSVIVQGEEESRITNVNKSEAMDLARNIRKDEFKGKAIIKAQKLTREERAENMQWLHEETLTYASI